jgi:hypothetical protein
MNAVISLLVAIVTCSVLVLLTVETDSLSDGGLIVGEPLRTSETSTGGHAVDREMNSMQVPSSTLTSYIYQHIHICGLKSHMNPIHFLLYFL